MCGVAEVKDIYKVSVSLVAGTLCAWSLAALFPSRTALYLGTSFLAVLAPASLVYRKSAVGLPLAMFFCGALCFLESGILAAGPVRTPLNADGLSSVIRSIPFSEPENNALLNALITGDRSHLDRHTVTVFRTSGASHLLALSGMHLGIIYVIIKGALSILGNSPVCRKLRRIAVILCCGAYTLMCGAAESLFRAWLFILLRETALILERPQDPRQIFCAALTIHLVLSPQSITSVGFQLSYLAMVGISFLWPLCRGWMDSRIWQAASLSVCCQIFTAPLSFLHFGTFPKYFLLTNLIAAPLMSAVMFSGICVAASGILFGDDTPLWLVRLSEYPVSLLRAFLDAVASLP